jgi:hypothetical protein
MKKMKGIRFLLPVAIGMIMLKSTAQNTPCNVTLNFTTITTNNGCAPKNVLAVWVEDDAGNFIRTVKLNAEKRKQYLYTWNDESAGNTVDAVTGATRTSHNAENIVWDGKNISKTVVPDGVYKLFIEFTEEHAQGPVLIIPFTKNTSNSDSTLANQTNFTNINLEYVINSVTDINNASSNSSGFSVFPNPLTNESKIQINVDKNTTANLYLYSLNGQIVAKLGQFGLIAGDNLIGITSVYGNNKIPAGTYLLRLEYNREIKILKLVKP